MSRREGSFLCVSQSSVRPGRLRDRGSLVVRAGRIAYRRLVPCRSLAVSGSASLGDDSVAAEAFGFVEKLVGSFVEALFVVGSSQHSEANRDGCHSE